MKEISYNLLLVHTVPFWKNKAVDWRRVLNNLSLKIIRKFTTTNELSGLLSVITNFPTTHCLTIGDGN